MSSFVPGRFGFTLTVDVKPVSNVQRVVKSNLAGIQAGKFDVFMGLMNARLNELHETLRALYGNRKYSFVRMRKYYSHPPLPTGSLADSFQAEITSGTEHHVKLSVKDALNRRKLLWLEKGTKPHDIRPIPPNKLLRFYWVDAGQWVSVPGVRHPGNQKDNHSLGNFKANVDKIVRLLRSDARKVFGKAYKMY